MLALVFSLILHVASGERINDALDSARAVFAERAERTTILIAPGTYYEQLTIDVPGVRLINAGKRPSIALTNHGVNCHQEAVRISWYHGHGYQYTSMGEQINYGGSRTRRWNASVLVKAPDFYAENIIFENSFNLYVSPAEALDEPTPIPSLKEGERTMPIRPKEVGSTAVQSLFYRERAAAISFTETATNARLKNCRATGRQDVLYGDQGASVYWQGGVLQGGVDFIFGAMRMVADRVTIVANVNHEKGDKCYIAAGRSGSDSIPARGLLFYQCHIRYATDDELQIVNRQSSNRQSVWLARPWRWWGETVWAYTTWDKQVNLQPEGWSTGLVKRQEGFITSGICPHCYEYRSQDKSLGRPAWVQVLHRPHLPDGTPLNPRTWLNTAK